MKRKICSTLSNKQQKELFLSIFGYLEENNFKDAAKEFAVEAKIENEKSLKKDYLKENGIQLFDYKEKYNENI
ncbi:hypothetical protein M0811_11048 [Anaeramoeba ignava]|uniref:LisH domain-containing protein n=1 Tax=Anaeramoeba ignava TaxID=1746090 RepID=A0A9Q0LCJ7_ANAIG|nr:hypothetical protein M0811_11048 [Anaeramoeba ignava]